MDENSSAGPSRIFPSLYVPTGDTAKDRLAFIHILERLKVRNKNQTKCVNALTIYENEDTKTHRMGGSQGMTVVYPSGSSCKYRGIDSQRRKVCSNVVLHNRE